MCRHRILPTMLAAIILVLPAGLAHAQSKSGAGWSTRALSPTNAAVRADVPADSVRSTAAAKPKGLVGTWRVSIPQSDGGLPPFNAYQTFNADGTFTEVSDLLTTQTESPAHGVWSGKRSDYDLTFELFVFDPVTKQPAGRVRVRAAIKLSDDGDSLTANTVVDFIAPDGSVAEGVDSGPFTGTRVKVVPVSGT